MDSLRRAVERDPMGASGTINHSDGWGFTIISKNNNINYKLHYKSTMPIYKDPNYQFLVAPTVGELANYGAIYGIAHVLNAADKSLIRVDSVHPIITYTGDGELHVVHNGVIDKYKAYEYIKRTYNMELDVKNLSDTYILTELIALMYDDAHDLEKVITELAAYFRESNGIESALNTGILLIRQCCVELFITSMYSRDVLNDYNRKKYYNIFIAKSNYGTIAASSTLPRIYGLAPFSNETELEPNDYELIYCRLQPKDISCKNA